MRKMLAFLFAAVLFFCMPANAEDWICPSCGSSASGNFCSECGTAHPPETWTCPQCQTVANGNFCYNCGLKRPEANGGSIEASDNQSLDSMDSGTEAGKNAVPEMLSVQAPDQYKEPGSIVSFGTYPQTAEGEDQTPIEWIVLDYDEAAHKALLLSRYGLDVVPYHKDYADITWEHCTLRSWLNGEFLNKAFSAAEQSAVLMTDVDNSKPQGSGEWDTDGGNNTQDRIFLLSCAEANRYLGVTAEDDNIQSRAAPTAYALARGAQTKSSEYRTADGEKAGRWWLRSPGRDLFNAAYVPSDGTLYDIRADMDDTVVRPAFWLNLESLSGNAGQ